MHRILAVFVALIALTGCGHEVAQSKPEEYAGPLYQSLRVDTPGTQGAHCTLTSPAATYTLTAPQNITVERSPYPLTVTCSKDNHFQGSTVIQPVLAYRTADREAYAYPPSVVVPMQINHRLMTVDNLVVF